MNSGRSGGSINLNCVIFAWLTESALSYAHELGEVECKIETGLVRQTTVVLSLRVNIQASRGKSYHEVVTCCSVVSAPTHFYDTCASALGHVQAICLVTVIEDYSKTATSICWHCL